MEKNKDERPYIYRGRKLSGMAGNSQSFLILDFQGLIPAQAVAVTVSEITNPHCPALYLAADLLLFPLCHPGLLFLAICRAMPHLVWGKPGSPGLDRQLS